MKTRTSTITGIILAAGAALATFGGGIASADTEAAVVAARGEFVPVVVATENAPALFVNTDAAVHNVRSVETDADGNPLFSSELIGIGEATPIAGVESLDARIEPYDFYCDQHNWMTGSLVVANADAPQL